MQNLSLHIALHSHRTHGVCAIDKDANLCGLVFENFLLERGGDNDNHIGLGFLDRSQSFIFADMQEFRIEIFCMFKSVDELE